MRLRPNRNQEKQIRKLSISIPGKLKPLVRRRAESLDLTVSQYIRRLVNEETKAKPLKVVTE